MEEECCKTMLYHLCLPLKKVVKQQKPPKARSPPVLPSQSKIQQATSAVHARDTREDPIENKQAAMMLETRVKMRDQSELSFGQRDFSQQDGTSLQTPTPPTRQDKEIIKLQQELKKARTRILALERELHILTEKCSRIENPKDSFCIEKFKDSDDIQGRRAIVFSNLSFFFDILGTSLLRCQCRRGNSSSKQTRGRPPSLSTENQLFLVLVRLRLGLFQLDLAKHVSYSPEQCEQIVYNLDKLHVSAAVRTSMLAIKSSN